MVSRATPSRLAHSDRIWFLIMSAGFNRSRTSDDNCSFRENDQVRYLIEKKCLWSRRTTSNASIKYSVTKVQFLIPRITLFFVIPSVKWTIAMINQDPRNTHLIGSKLLNKLSLENVLRKAIIGWDRSQNIREENRAAKRRQLSALSAARQSIPTLIGLKRSIVTSGFVDFTCWSLVVMLIPSLPKKKRLPWPFRFFLAFTNWLRNGCHSTLWCSIGKFWV